MKKLILVMVFCASIVFSGPASAETFMEMYTDTKGPHNENGNAYLDIKSIGDFNGGIGVVIDDINSTTNKGNMPIARKVSTQAEADIIVYFDESITAERSSFFTHKASEPDEVRVNPWEKTQPQRLAAGKPMFHELGGHAESMTHQFDADTGENYPRCADLVGGSVMCHKPYHSEELSLHNHAVLRNLANKREGYTLTTSRLAMRMVDPTYTVN